MTRSNNLALGTTLIAVGVLFLLDALHVPVLAQLWKAWPLVLVAFGVTKLVQHRRGLPSRLRTPERLLIVLVTLAGVIVSVAADRPTVADGGGHESQDGGGIRLPPPDRSESERKTIMITPGQTLDVDVAGADLEIIGTAGGTVLATVLTPRHKSAVEPALALESGGSGPEVRFESTASEEDGRALVRLLVPPGTRLDVHHRSGSVAVRDGFALELEGDDSDVTLERLQGAAEVKLASGSLDVQVVSGNLEVEAEVCNVKAVGIGAGASVHVRYGNVTLQGVGGGIEVTANDGAIRAEGVGGSAEVTGLRSAIQLRGVRGAVKVDSHEGAVTLEGIEGSAVIDARAARINVSGIQGNLVVTTTMGDVSLAAVGGNAIVHVEDGDTVVRDGQGRVEVDARRGEVRLERVHGGGAVKAEDGNVFVEVTASGAPFAVETERGNVTLAMGRAGARLSLEASPGAIQNRLDLPLAVAVEGAHASLESTVRSGTSPVTVEAHQGLIRLQD